MKGLTRRRIAVWLAALLCTSTVLVATSNPSSAAATSIIPKTLTVGGGAFACALDQSSAAWCWGTNINGQLGDGTTTSRSTPTLVQGGLTFTQLVAQGNAVCGLVSGGTAYCWGQDNYGQLGDGGNTNRTAPYPVSGGLSFTALGAGTNLMCGLVSGGAEYCWGQNLYGGVGDGTTTNRNTPTLVSGGFSFVSMGVSYVNNCSLTSAGAAYCWGSNSNGQLGDGTTTNHLTPALVSGGITFSSLDVSAATGNHECGLTLTGQAYCWGKNQNSQLGDGTTTDRSIPTLVTGGQTFVSLGLGGNHSCGINTVGVAYCWGYGYQYILGTGNQNNQSSPVAVASSNRFLSIGGGSAFTCGLTNTTIYCWGDNTYGQIGNNTTNAATLPTQVWTFNTVTNVVVSATIDPTFTFSVTGRTTACNGESNFVTAAGSSTGITLGHATSSSNISGGQTLSVGTNAGGGFAVYVRGVSASGNLASTTRSFADVTGTYAAPAPLIAGEQFGYTYLDSTASSTVTSPAAAKFVKLDNATTNAVMAGPTGTTTGSSCVSFDAQTSATTAAGSYSAVVIYTAVPTF